MRNQDFVSFLVDETLKLQESGEVELSSLELKLNDYGLSFLKGEYIPQAQVLHFVTPFGPLDIPVNWSVFMGGSNHTLLEEGHDPDCFLSVIKAAWNKPLSKLLITHADGFCYLVGLKAGEDAHVHDLINPQEWLKTG